MRLEICYLDQYLIFLYDPFQACKHHFEILYFVKELPHQIHSKMPLDNSFTKFQATILLKKNSSIFEVVMGFGWFHVIPERSSTSSEQVSSKSGSFSSNIVFYVFFFYILINFLCQQLVLLRSRHVFHHIEPIKDLHLTPI